MTQPPCPLCASPGGVVVFQGEKFRVIRAQEAGFPAFYRVVWTAHVAEFSDLSVADRSLCMAAVNVLELALRAHLQPTKINLAALGNVVPHLHWHVIARFDWDSHYPSPVWCPAQRPVDSAALAVIQGRLEAVDMVIKSELSALCPAL
ncbi:MAG: HIT family protein [Rhodoferax sp.]|uniref:HIT family protein n=1 Tax=Rhodoferax sp. TaxID=50421 RepID=UPI00271B3FB2|nr:HIT family protein [Rhodoferax sp.]MDO8448889.1 HIT family protein [Rhodoferax sp.]